MVRTRPIDFGDNVVKVYPPKRTAISAVVSIVASDKNTLQRIDLFDPFYFFKIIMAKNHNVANVNTMKPARRKNDLAGSKRWRHAGTNHLS